ncbi:MAG: hypothetical protein QNI92_16400, partial [Desulfobacterales bacterium]|nr:hypothetical protein [Desulfobacterales bacterium]
MRDKESSDFKIDLDEELEDPLYREQVQEIQQQKVEKLGQRVTLFGIIITVLISVICIIAYLDIKRRVLNYQSAGAQQTQTISQDLASKFSSLSVQYAQVQDEFSQNLKSFDGKINNLSKKLTGIEKSIKSIKSTKSDRKELKQAITNFNKSLVPMRDDLNQMMTDIQSLDRTIQQEISDVAGALRSVTDRAIKLKTDIETMSAEVDTIADNQLDEQMLAQAIRSAQKKNQDQLDVIIRRFETKIAALQKKIDQVKA